MILRVCGLFLGMFLLSVLGKAQQNRIVLLNQERTYYEHVKADTNTFLTYFPSIRYDKRDAFTILDPQANLSFNSTYPRGYNDGPVWKGKGFTQELHAGFQWKKGLFNATFYPVIYYSQNASFDLASINPYQNKYNYQFGVSRNVDFVQRYGDVGFTKFHLGQSEIALRTRAFQLSASTQNFILGPARYNSIIMSNSGAGFPHITVGTPGKLDLEFKGIDLGGLEANIFYGLLSESDYFDTLSTNDKRYFNGLSVGYEIPYLTGLTIGFQKALFKNTEHFEGADLFSMFHIKDDGIILSDQGDTLLNSQNDTFDQLASAFIEWKIPDYDMRVFFEFARNDFNGSFRRIMNEFEHSRAYSLGLEKAFELKSGDGLHIYYEHTFLPRYMSYQYRPTPPFYTHHVAKQGYTNDGQLLGAGIGPGSVSDLFILNWMKPKGYLGFSLQRIRFDEDYFIVKIPNTLDKIERHDVEFTLGFKYARQFDQFFWGFDANLSYRYNMYFELQNDKFNFGGKVFARYLINKK